MKINNRSAFVIAALLCGASVVCLADSSVSEQISAPQRHIALDGVHNLRDMGGYLTEDGQRVRWGVLYRSSQLSDISATDRSKLEGLGIRTVCDLRNARERELRADPTLNGWQFDQRCNTATSEMKMPTDQKIDWEKMFTGFYRVMAKQYVPQYRALFDDLKQQKTPLLLHCTAGKDRTGVGSALILLALGVPQATVIADYQLTEKFEPANPSAIMGDHPELANIPALKAANPAYLQAALDGIAQEYGSLDNYFANALGVTAQDRQQLRAQLLEPAVTR